MVHGRRFVLTVGLAAGCTFPSVQFAQAPRDAATDAPLDANFDAPLDALPDGSTRVDAAPDHSSDVPLAESGVFMASPSCPAPTGAECLRVRVGGGRVTLGAEGTPSAPPQPEVTVGDFVVDATEVTVHRFRFFSDALSAAGAPARFTASYPTAPPTTLGVDRASLPSPLVDSGLNCNWTTAPRGARESHPINCATWEVAFAFCAWDGGRLPTEAEYEYLARGWASPVGSAWPWGDRAPDCATAHWRASVASGVCRGDDMQSTRRVGSLAPGARWGVFDLAGNIAEWTADEHLPYATRALPNACWGSPGLVNPLCRAGLSMNRVLRGGGWFDDDPSGDSLRGAARAVAFVRNASSHWGLRCVRAAPP